MHFAPVDNSAPQSGTLRGAPFAAGGAARDRRLMADTPSGWKSNGIAFNGHRPERNAILSVVA
jgi:hypothetical protein